jgi:SAM-dependent methyltransferase
MHHTALIAGRFFAELYGKKGMVVIDIGGQDVNGSLRKFFEDCGMKYICVDMVKHTSVDVVVNPGEKLPFEDGFADLIVSTSCFEHDPCFWMTFKEMCRITKLGGFIYVNAPSAGAYHGYPGDNWRFYADAGQALSVWSGKKISNEDIFPVKLEETFHIEGPWTDFVSIWKRVEDIETNITVSSEIKNKNGILKVAIQKSGMNTK